MPGIITLDYARSGLRLPPGQVVDDGDLQDLILAATPVVEDLVGTVEQKTYDETYDGGSPLVRLLNAPVVSITSVTEAYGGGYFRTLTNQPVDSGSYDAFGYTADLSDAILTRRVVGQATAFVGGRRNIHVVYVAGRATPYPGNIQRATRRLVRWLWQTEMQGQRPPSSSPDAVASTPSGYDVPVAVIRLCGPDLRIPGIG